MNQLSLTGCCAPNTEILDYTQELDPEYQHVFELNLVLNTGTLL